MLWMRMYWRRKPKQMYVVRERIIAKQLYEYNVTKINVWIFVGFFCVFLFVYSTRQFSFKYKIKWRKMSFLELHRLVPPSVQRKFGNIKRNETKKVLWMNHWHNKSGAAFFLLSLSNDSLAEWWNLINKCMSWSRAWHGLNSVVTSQKIIIERRLSLIKSIRTI